MVTVVWDTELDIALICSGDGLTTRWSGGGTLCHASQIFTDFHRCLPFDV